MSEQGTVQIQIVPDGTRRCGECTLCCKLLPVKGLPFVKGAGERCKHQRMGKGCAIYAARPASCRLWNCRWLGDPEATRDLRRPDRAHYVIDVMPDYVTVTDRDSSDQQKIPVLQIWCDAAHPDAHRDPALRAFLEAEGRQGFAALVRYAGDSGQGWALFSPTLTGKDHWVEVPTDRQMAAKEHTPDEIAAVLAATATSPQQRSKEA